MLIKYKNSHASSNKFQVAMFTQQNKINVNFERIYLFLEERMRHLGIFPYAEGTAKHKLKQSKTTYPQVSTTKTTCTLQLCMKKTAKYLQ